MFQPFTVGIPVFNEDALLEENVRRLVAYLRDLETPFELLVGSNGSTDDTESIGHRLAEELPEVSSFMFRGAASGWPFGSSSAGLATSCFCLWTWICRSISTLFREPWSS